ncbi:hypothetical protein ARMGADRAFT_299420 [Armillaria gallica]|uniref:Uncharacterized protein n=1 Tax=Armillaria gallica TaxID=47427 RepID=A0A2H3DSW7_ARMGA|nr:hypothetical protein ARMGADRAFT_299420 [Armillaria gallica]
MCKGSRGITPLRVDQLVRKYGEAMKAFRDVVQKGLAVSAALPFQRMDVFYSVEEPGTVLFSLQTDIALTGKNVLIRLFCFLLTGLFTLERM